MAFKMISKVSIYFVIIVMAAASTKHGVYEEIYNAFKNVQTFADDLDLYDLFLHNYKQTLPLLEQPSFNVSASDVSMRNFHKNSTDTYDDLFGTCLYGKHFKLSLPSRTKNAIEFTGDIKETYYTYKLTEKQGTFAVTYNGIKFHLNAENENHINKTVKFENSEDRFDTHLRLQLENEEFKKQILEPMIYEKLTEWVDGNAPLHSIISHCFNQHRGPQSSKEPYQIQVSKYTVSISGLSDLQEVFFVNDGSSVKIELHTSSLNCTIKQTDGADTMPSNPTVRCAGLRIYKDTHIEYGHIPISKIKVAVSMKDFDIIETPVTPESAVFDSDTVRAIRNHVQESIKESLLRYWYNE